MIIKPNKYTNLDLSVLNISAECIRYLLKKNIVKYEELLLLLENSYGPDARFVYIDALNFLYLLGKVTYHKDIDCIELI